MHVMIAVFFIDKYLYDKLYAFVIGTICIVLLYVLKPNKKAIQKKMMKRTYYYLLFAIFLSIISIVYKVNVSYEWFSVYGFKIWLNVISLMLIIKTSYGYMNIDRYQRKHSHTDIKAKSLLSKDKQ